MLATAVILATNPSRHQVLQRLLGALQNPVRLIPLTAGTLIPTTFAKWLWGCALLAGWSWLGVERVRGRALIYGIGSLVLFCVPGLVVWTTTIRWWSSSRWSSDAAQGWFILAFAVAYFLSVFHIVRFWMHDLLERCPECLDRLCMPLELGREHALLVEAGGIESACLRGHGAVRRTRWARTFHPVTGFWKQLL